IMPSKRIDLALEALSILRQSTRATLTLVGPEEPVYSSMLRAKYQKLIDEGAVTFLGPKPNAETPALYSAHGLLLHLASAGHLDKSVLESMACETPVVLTSVAFGAVVTPEWVVRDTPATLAEGIQKMLHIPDDEYQALGTTLRQSVVGHHSLGKLVDQ